MNQGGDAANFRDPSVVYDAVNKQYYLTVVSGQQASFINLAICWTGHMLLKLNVKMMWVTAYGNVHH